MGALIMTHIEQMKKFDSSSIVKKIRHSYEDIFLIGLKLTGNSKKPYLQGTTVIMLVTLGVRSNVKIYIALNMFP